MLVQSVVLHSPYLLFPIVTTVPSFFNPTVFKSPAEIAIILFHFRILLQLVSPPIRFPVKSTVPSLFRATVEIPVAEIFTTSLQLATLHAVLVFAPIARTVPYFVIATVCAPPIPNLSE